MPLVSTRGAASAQGFGEFAQSTPPVYIEDVFQTWLYTGNSTSGGTQTINNGIDLSGKGGMVWIKGRSNSNNNMLYDTVRGAGTGSSAANNRTLCSNTSEAQGNAATSDYLSAFSATGFSVTQGGGATSTRSANYSAFTYASWTFREQPKFFDVVTYTGNGATNTINHNLGSVPGCIIVKSTSISGSSWYVYHRSLGVTSGRPDILILNDTGASSNGQAAIWPSVPTSTTFQVGSGAALNQSGQSFVAYIFAHDAGGFGLTGTDNVISCGSFTTNGSGVGSATLGYEPQWVLLKPSNTAGNWFMYDTMREMPVGTNNAKVLYSNLSDAEATNGWGTGGPSATGFNVTGFGSSVTYIYIAIRRGPMKVPTTGTSVLGLSARTGTGGDITVTGSAGVTDLAIIKNRGSVTNWVWVPRLLGTRYRSSNNTSAEVAAGATILQANPWDVMDGVKIGTSSNLTNASGNTFIDYLLDRAPGFMDVVCYRGDGTTNLTVAHNLGVPPEMMIVFGRGGGQVYVYHQAYGNQAFAYLTGFAVWETSGAIATTIWRATTPTSTSFFLGNASNANGNGENYTNYLFASCPGVSKVGSYTGNGTTQTINCGFTGGARFVMIKSGSAAGNWRLYDTARGIVSGNEPELFFNLDNAEQTVYDALDPAASGFIVNTNSADINNSGVTYVFLAIA